MEERKELEGINIYTGTEGAEQLEGIIAEEMSDSPEQSGDNPKKVKLPKLPQPNRYHGYPTNWDRSMAAYYSGMEMKDIMEQANFHRIALNEVRKALKGKCTHLTHVTDSSGIITFRAKLNINGRTKVVNVDSEMMAKDLEAETYRNLNNLLLDEFRN